MTKKILFTSGGTGGHIFPAINLMNFFYKKGHQVVLVTDNRGYKFLKEYPNLKSNIIKTDTPTNKNFFKKIYSFINIVFAIFRSILILKKEKPNLVIGFGGYVSFPLCFATRFYKIPLVIYENNIVIGKTNKSLMGLSKKVLLSKKVKDFPINYENKFYIVGNILKEEVLKFSNYKKKSDIFSILVLGGSQGAEIFGKIIPEAIKIIKDKGYKIEIYQQCISEQQLTLENFYDKNNIKNNIFSFSSDLVKLYSSVDLAITRSGASTTAELLHTAIPFVAVPYPYSIDNHQHLNAKYYQDIGCCWVLEQNNFNKQSLSELIINILEDNKQLINIQTNMKENTINNVYDKVEEALKEFI